MEATKVLLPAHEMTTAQCVIECSGYLRTIANQEFEGEDWQTAPKYRRRNLLTDFLACIELTGEEFAELCGLIGFQPSKTTTAKLAKFTVIAYDWQGEANGEATADILAALNKCEGVTLIEQRGYRPQARTYDYLRFHIAAFWRCLVNELRSLCLGVGLVVRPKEIPATPTETLQISTETAETVNVSAEGENAAGTKEMPRYECPNYADYAFERGWSIENTDFDAHSGVLCMIHFDPTDEKYVCGCLWQVSSDSPNYTEHKRFKTLKGAQNYGTKRMGMKLKYQTLTVHCSIAPTEPPQSPETPQTEVRTAEPMQSGTDELNDECGYRICSHCGKRFHEGYYLGDEYACSEECAVALYGGDRELFEADLEMEENEPDTTECYWSVWN